jgi:flagellar hook-basal body complex protein FliE
MTPSIGPLNLGSLSGAPSLPPAPPNLASSAAGAPSFKDMLLDSVQQVNTMQLDANRAVEGLFTGDEVNPAEVLTAVQKADLAFRMLMQVRNKLVAAYQEIKDVKV